MAAQVVPPQQRRQLLCTQGAGEGGQGGLGRHTQCGAVQRVWGPQEGAIRCNRSGPLQQQQQHSALGMQLAAWLAIWKEAAPAWRSWSFTPERSVYSNVTRRPLSLRGQQ